MTGTERFIANCLSFFFRLFDAYIPCVTAYIHSFGSKTALLAAYIHWPHAYIYIIPAYIRCCHSIILAVRSSRCQRNLAPVSPPPCLPHSIHSAPTASHLPSPPSSPSNATSSDSSEDHVVMAYPTMPPLHLYRRWLPSSLTKDIRRRQFLLLATFRPPLIFWIPRRFFS